jgi:DNA replication and repair protein RecF
VKLRRIALRRFRNIGEAALEFEQPRIVVLGANGQGKTNLLEAVHLLCITRSFRRVRNDQLATTGQGQFTISATFESSLRGRRSASVTGGRGGLDFELDGEAVRGRSRIFGQFPLVLLSPEKAVISQGGPEQRRRFLDQLICFGSVTYLDTLQRYQRALKQRNSLLMARGGPGDGASLETWETELARLGVDITVRRQRFLEEWVPLFRSIYREEFGQALEADLVYRPGLGERPDAGTLMQELRTRRDRDRARGGTTLGPHRDDLDFLLDGRLLRDYGSQGQHKLFLLGLVLAETRILEQVTGEEPLLLLDDLFGVLDDERIALIGEKVGTRLQMMITTTSPRHLDVLGRRDSQVFHCEQGTYREVTRG